MTEMGYKRTFDEKEYRLFNYYHTKRDAEQIAKGVRKAHYLARIVKESVGYCLYVRRK